MGVLCETPPQLSPVLLLPDISHIKSKLQEISKMLEKPKPCKLGLGGG